MKLTITAFLSLLVLVSRAQTEDQRPVVASGSTTANIKIDGLLEEEGWTNAGRITDFRTTVPVQDGDPSGKTTIKIVTNSKYFAIGIKCFDEDPSGIINFSKLRDTDLSEEDYIKVIIDPFQDGQSGYIFAINPNGARYDALVSNRGESENKDWDAIWEAAAIIHDEGWSAEIKIPIQSINFKPGLKEWGFNVERNIQRNQEIIRWANVRRDQWFTQTSRAGLITGLPDFDYGVGLNVRPSVILKINDEAGSKTEYDVDPALTISKRLGANMTATATFNTDFAETEVDTRQTNLTRFPLFFPEKRAFFLEGSDIFEFGFGLSRDIVPFFSRRIGLLQGNQIPILAGGKVNGRVNRASFGGVVMRTGNQLIVEDDTSSFELPASTMSVVRFKQNVLKESSFGFFGSHGDPEGRSGAFTSGADFTYQTTRFQGNKNFLVGTWAMYNDREDLSGDQSAYGLKVDYPNDIWDIAFTYTHIGDGFQPSLGFVPRNGINKIVTGGTWGPRPEWKLVRQIRNQIFFTYIADLDWDWQTYRVFTAPLNWRFESGERFEFNIVPQGERLIEPFGISDDVTIPTEKYNFIRYRLEAEVAAKRRLNGEFTWWFGEFFNGHLDEYQATINWNPATIVTFEFSGTRNIADLPSGNFDQTLLGFRVRFNATPDLQLNSFIQYDTDSDNFGLNSRIHWIFHPQGDFFIVYNSTSNYLSSEDRFVRENSQLLVKLRYNFRL
ncbi:MAG: DUF5916 domain-containing protein [Cyclobacteriaceae bacterium]